MTDIWIAIITAPGGMRTITLNPGDVPPDNGVDYIVESNHYTNYTDQ